MSQTTIEWTDKTWNPVTGCTKVSEGCARCYAEAIANRFWGDRKFSDVQFHEDRLKVPMTWGTPCKVFVNSMSDLFHESVTFKQIDQIFAVMAMTNRHTFQILTKRPKRMLEYFTDYLPDVGGVTVLYKGAKRVAIDLSRSLPLPNVWLGVSAENQKAADERIPLLLRTPAAVRFLSCEPLLEKVVLKPEWLGKWTPPGAHSFAGRWGERYAGEAYIDQVIIGGESGSKARPCYLGWMRSLVRQSRDAGVSPFVKQLGSNPIDSSPCIEGVAVCNYYPLKLRDRKGGDIAEFPEDLQIREFPQVAISEEAIANAV